MGTQQDYVTLLKQWSSGDNAATEQLKTLFYEQLKRMTHEHLARAESSATETPFALLSQTTSIFHGLLAELVPPQELIETRRDFFRFMSLFIHRSLCDLLRKERAHKRGGQLHRTEFPDDLASDDEHDSIICLDQALQQLHDESPRTMDYVLMHYYGGLNIDDIATLHECSPRSVYNQLASAKAFIRTRMEVS